MEPAVDNIRARQIAALRTVVNLNQPVHNAMVSEPVWKVLVLDRLSQDIISPLLSVKNLRELGVTLHMLLEKKRDPLPEVPAVYLLSPSDENVDLVCNDLRSAIYGAFYINTVSPLSRPRLELLATAAVQGGAVNAVQKVVDQYLNFISLEEDLFVLRRCADNTQLPYYIINDPSTSEEQMSSLLESIADGLFSVCATLGVVPIIRCPSGNAAELVATRLDQKLRDNLRDARNNLFAGEAVRAAGHLQPGSRALLLIADRSADLATMLHHTWSYQALIHDVLELEQNRVTMKDAAGRRKEYDLATSGGDSLWKGQKGAAFPLVAEAIQAAVDEYKGKDEEIRRLKQHIGMGDDAEAELAMGSLLSDATNKLGNTVTSLPALLEQKRLIDQHTNIATALLEAIKQRKLDSLFEIEQRILQNTQLERPLLDELSSLTSGDDAIRVILIYLLSHPNISKSERDDLLKHVRSMEFDEAAIHFIEKIRCVSELSRGGGSGEVQEGSAASKGLFSKFISHSSNLFMEGVKTLIPKKRNLILTQMVDSVITASTPSSIGVPTTTSSAADQLRLFDPKLMHALSKEAGAARSRQLPPPADVILFVVGGGNYVEYQNLVEYGRAKGITRVTYGCTELINPKQFLDQLTLLGRQVR